MLAIDIIYFVVYIYYMCTNSLASLHYAKNLQFLRFLGSAAKGANKGSKCFY